VSSGQHARAPASSAIDAEQIITQFHFATKVKRNKRHRRLCHSPEAYEDSRPLHGQYCGLGTVSGSLGQICAHLAMEIPESIDSRGIFC